MLIMQPASSVSVHQLRKTSTTTTIITPATEAATPTFTSTITTLGDGRSAHTFPSIGVRTIVHTIGITGIAAHTGTTRTTVHGDGMTMVGIIHITTDLAIIHIMAEAAWAIMSQASDTTTTTHLVQ